jgi:hypothetical protein
MLATTTVIGQSLVLTPAIGHSPVPTLATSPAPLFAPMTDISLLILPAISPAILPVLLKGPLMCEKQSPPTITLTNTTTTTTTTTTSASTQPVEENDQIVKSEQEVRTRHKRLHKHISKEPDDSNLVDFKPIVTQIDDSNTLPQ